MRIIDSQTKRNYDERFLEVSLIDDNIEKLLSSGDRLPLAETGQDVHEQDELIARHVLHHLTTKRPIRIHVHIRCSTAHGTENAQRTYLLRFFVNVRLYFWC